MGKKNKKVGRLPSRKDSYKEEEGESIIEEEDISFIKAHSEQLKFLASMNSDALSSTNNTRKPKKDLDRVPTLKVKDRPNGSLKPQELSETEDEEDAESLGDSDAESSDLEVLSGSDPGEIYSDVDASGSEVSSDYNYHDNDDDKEEEEEEKEVEGEIKQDVYEMEDLTVDRPLLNRKERKLLKRKAQMAGLMEYETKARRFSEDQSDDDGMKLSKTRLPIKDLSGRLARVKDEEDEPRSEGNEANSDESEAEETDEDDEGEEEEEEEEEGMGSGSDQDREDGAEGSFNDKEILALKDLLNLPKKQYIVARKVQMADIASAVMQDPERNIGQLRQLAKISEGSDGVERPKVRKLALLTQLAVYKDIIPDYRIRELTAAEKAVKVSKEVKAQRRFEESLVHLYKGYVTQLHRFVVKAAREFKQTPQDKDKLSWAHLGEVAVQCIGELLVAHPHFNFRNELIADVVYAYVQPPFRVQHPNYTRIAMLGRKYIEQLFQIDVSGEYAKEAAECASKRIKRFGGGFAIDPSCLRPWLKLRLRSELDANPEDRRREEREAELRHREYERRKIMRKKKGSTAALLEAKRGAKLSKKQKKIAKEQKAVERDLMQAEAEVRLEERTKWHEKTLSAVFVTYFRILKQYVAVRSKCEQLLPAVLEGLARFAHLISVDFFPDLLAILKQIITDDDSGGGGKISTRSALLCILTAVHMLIGQGEALNLDLSGFYHRLYALLAVLACETDIEVTAVRRDQPADASQRDHHIGQDEKEEEDTWDEAVRSEADLLFDCLNRMFITGPKTSPQRVAAFVKRLMVASLYWPPKTSARSIRFVHRLFIKYPLLVNWLVPDDPTDSKHSHGGNNDDDDNEIGMGVDTSALVSGGVYGKELDNPDMCNAFAIQLYEMHWLQTHHNADVRAAVADLALFAKQVAKQRSSKGV